MKNNPIMTSAPITRTEKRKSRSKKIRKFGVGVGLLIVLCIAYVTIKDFHKQGSSMTMAASKTTEQSNAKHLQKNSNTSTKNPSNVTSKESSVPSGSVYMFSDSDKRVLGTNDIAALSKEQLRLARNEIYARHGYVFKSEDLQKYFSSKSWYHANPSYDGSLNTVEKENIQLLKAREDSMN